MSPGNIHFTQRGEGREFLLDAAGKGLLAHEQITTKEFLGKRGYNITMFGRLIYIMVFFSAATVSAQRQERIRLPFPYNGIYEGEYHFKIEKPAQVQGMAHYGEQQWSRHAHLLWDGKPGDVLRLPFLVRFDSKYDISLRLTSSGLWRLQHQSGW